MLFDVVVFSCFVQRQIEGRVHNILDIIVKYLISKEWVFLEHAFVNMQQ